MKSFRLFIMVAIGVTLFGMLIVPAFSSPVSQNVILQLAGVIGALFALVIYAFVTITVSLATLVGGIIAAIGLLIVAHLASVASNRQDGRIFGFMVDPLAGLSFVVDYANDNYGTDGVVKFGTGGLGAYLISLIRSLAGW